MKKNKLSAIEATNSTAAPTISAPRAALLAQAKRIGVGFNDWSVERAVYGKPLMRIVITVTGKHRTQLNAFWIELFYSDWGQVKSNYIQKGGLNYDVDALQAACKIPLHRRRVGKAEENLARIRSQLRELDQAEGLGRWCRRGEKKPS